MKLKFRRSNQNDLESIYNLHMDCFNTSDHWYKSNIKHYLDKGIVVEFVDSNSNIDNKPNQIIGVLLQGSIVPCNKKFNEEELDDSTHKINSGYKEDIFEPVSSDGEIFFKNNLHYKELYGIVMICVDSKFRGKGLAKKLIEKHFTDNTGKLVCLNTRRTNVNAYLLYKKMGYEHIAYIKNKYFQPTEDSIFMIRDLSTDKENQ